MGFKVIIEPETDLEFEGYYNAYCPSLSGCCTYGESYDEALDNIKEAMKLYIENLIAHNRPIPQEEKVRVLEIELPLAV